MVSLCLFKKDYAYMNLHAEQAYRITPNNYVEESIGDENYELGIGVDKLTYSVISDIQNNGEKIIEECLKNDIKYLIVDFEGIGNMQANVRDYISKVIEQFTSGGLSIYLVNINMALAEKLKHIKIQESLIERKIDLQEENVIISYLIRGSENILKGKNIKAVVNEINKYIFEENIKYCSEETNKSLDSSAVFTNKYIDIKKCIENKENFPYMIYCLALKLQERKRVKNRFSKDAEIILFCHTLNGAYIASLLSHLLSIDILFYDHIGPKNKLYNTYLGNKIKKKKEYIVVADVICLGSELRAVKTLLEYEGARYLGGVSIVKIETIDEQVNNIEALLCINKDNNPIEYKIYTNIN